MDEKGFAYTLDAVLALIPIMIVLFTVSNITASPESHSEVLSNQKAQDIMELMARYTDADGMTVLDSMSNALSSGNNSEASIKKSGQIASSFLDKNLPCSYLLTEENQLKGKPIAGKLDLDNARNLATASRNCGSYTFRIYVE
ncbi:MAG: hypothetical protein HVN35_05965 [Methanobacteriaceae archaeon]|nr:hypothetical protein [Methanobacteriaceae archaeon]